MKFLSDEPDPAKIAQLPRKHKKYFADFIRRVMPKRIDTPQSRERAESAAELLRLLEDPTYPLFLEFVVVFLNYEFLFSFFRKDMENIQMINDFSALVKGEGGAQPGPISEVPFPSFFLSLSFHSFLFSFLRSV